MGIGKDILKFITKQAKVAMQTQKRVLRAKQVVDESLELAANSAKPETRISRMEVAIERIEHMCREFPLWPEADNWKRQLAGLKRTFPDFFAANLSDLISLEIEKIRSMKSAKAKEGRAIKLVAKLREFRGKCPEADGWLQEQIALLQRCTAQGEWEVEIPGKWKGTFAEQTQDAASNAESAKKPVSLLGKLGAWLKK